jgi:hypothetical protein
MRGCAHMGVLSFQGKRFFEMLSGASQVLNFGLLDQVFCTRSGRGRNSALTLGFLWVAPEPWYFYVDRELAVTTWVVFLFRVVRFRWGALSGVPPRYSACPARPLYGWARSKYSPNCLDIAVVLWPCNLTTSLNEVARQVMCPDRGWS